MIAGRLSGTPGRRAPFVRGRVLIPSLRAGGDVSFLIDTGSPSTILAPADAAKLALDLSQLPSSLEITGVGGSVAAVAVPTTLTMGTRSIEVDLRILVPQVPYQDDVWSLMPSVLGRDILGQFALFLEERTSRVLLLEPDEADQLRLP